MDTIFDWGSWTGTNPEGDFKFSNDKDRVISWTLCAISIFGTVLFLISTISMWRFERRFKRIIVLQLGFENFAQGILYIIVASSQASGSGNIHISVIIGIVQALCFCGFQIFELRDLAAVGGTGDNDITMARPPSPSPSPSPSLPPTSGGGQPVVVSMSPAAPIVTPPSP